jgi:hypothetical protein
MSKSIASMAYLYIGCLVHSAHQALSCGVIEDLWQRICPPRLGVNFYCESMWLSHLKAELNSCLPFVVRRSFGRRSVAASQTPPIVCYIGPMLFALVVGYHFF